MYCAKNWTLLVVNQKHLKSFEKWCWRRMEITWTYYEGWNFNSGNYLFTTDTK